MRYSKIFIQIWNDLDFLDLEEGEQLMFMYLMTSPHSNLLGCYCLKVGYVCEDLKIDKEVFDARIKVLDLKGFVKWYDSDTILILPNYIKHNQLTNSNQIIASKKIINSLHLSVSIKKDLSQIIQGVKDLRPDYKQVLTIALDNVLPYVLPYSEEETEEEVEEEKETELRFTRFWNQYPRKEGKTKAHKTFKKVVKNKKVFTDLLKALSNYKKSIKILKTDYKFIKHGSTFMNNWIDYLEWEEPKGGKAIDKYIEAGLIKPELSLGD